MLYSRLFLTLFCCASVFGLDKKFSVTESFGIPRANAPVEGGIAFCKGEIPDASALSLFQDGAEIPGQFIPLTRYGDNSLQWVLMNFTDDFSSGQKKNYTVRTRKSVVVHPRSISVSRSGSEVTLDNGHIRMKIDTLNFRGIHSLEYAGASLINGNGGLALNDTVHGSPSVNGKVSKAGFVYLGSLRATLRVQGEFFKDSAGGLGYTYYVTVYAGSPQIRISATVRNSVNPVCGRAARLSYAKAFFTLGLDPLDAVAYDTVLKAGYASSETDTLRSTRGYNFTGGVGLMVTEKWGGGLYQPNINGTRINGRTLEVDIIRRLQARQNSSTSGNPYWYPRFYVDSIYPMRDLTHKTSEIILECRSGAVTGSLLRDWAHNAKCRLRPWQDPQSLADADAFSAGKFGTVADETEAYRTWGWTVPLGVKGQQFPATQTDAAPRLDINIHGDTETDPARNFLLQWARTGNQGLFDIAESWVKYFRDHVTYRTTDFMSDGQYIAGSRYAQYVKRMPKVPTTEDEIYGYSVADYNAYSGCHTAMEGVADYYCFTGDPDALEALIDYGEVERAMTQAAMPDTLNSTESFYYRAHGRKFCFLLRLYEITRAPVWGDLLKIKARAMAKSIHRDPLV